MSQRKGEDELSEAVRKEIFQALVDAQDQDPDVARSRKVIVERFGVSDAQLRRIEREGIEAQWPPL